MKRFFVFLPLLCLFFRAAGQENMVKAGTNGPVDLVAGGVTVGRTVPDVLIRNITGLELNGKPVSEARLSDFKGRLLILDFWATWCGPCRTLIYHLDSLRKVFGDKVVFLPVTYETRAVAEPVLAAMGKVRPFELPDVTGDKELQKLFPHRTLPHEVWIDGSGVVRAITGYDGLTQVNIRRLLSGAGFEPARKEDLRIPFDKTKPLLLAGNGGDGAGMVWHSVLSKYIPGLSGSMEITAFDAVKGQRYSVRNAPLLLVYEMAFGEHDRVFPNARVRILSRDSLRINSRLKGPAYRDWLAAGNGWCYELVLPPQLADNGFAVMQQELRMLFAAYRVSVDTQVVRSLVLVRTSAADKLKSAGGAYRADIGPFSVHLRHAFLNELMMRLERQYMQGSPLAMADGTGYRQRVDLDLDAPLSDLKALNKALAVYDLAFIERDYPAQLLVIRDNDVHKP